MSTYLLHVAGKTIGRESGLRPMPLQADSVDDRKPFEDAMLATVRRCLPLPAGVALTVEWNGRHRASVTVRNLGPAHTAARFTIKPATPADHQVDGARLPKGYAR